MTRIWSSDPIERVNQELARRHDVFGKFPNAGALLRPGTAVLVEKHGEWLTQNRRHLPQASMARLRGGVPMTTLGDLFKEDVAVGPRFRLDSGPQFLTGRDPRSVARTHGA